MPPILTTIAFVLCCLAYTVSAARIRRDDDGEGSGHGDEGEEDGKTSTHGVIACVAYAILLIGAVLMRALKGPKTWLVHACTQAIGLVLVVASAALGIELAQSTHSFTDAHVVIGLLLFASIWVLALGGLLHHLSFRKYRRPTFIGTAHAWSARTIITLAIINGGLGLALAGGHGVGAYAAYGIVTGVIWICWVGFTIISMRRESRDAKA
ncbi:hypothetical protein D0860_06153 [Hortaea werneckii]|uniref:Cytochrome b561 domain-containing protein n=1 Tax=Hortaea werneckii TaxID=91943 RepID=A0A3M7GV42_HORWE|nr:hypothetical protein D0860_06153 [Hortaea werneckii]